MHHGLFVMIFFISVAPSKATRFDRATARAIGVVAASPVDDFGATKTGQAQHQVACPLSSIDQRSVTREHRSDGDHPCIKRYTRQS